MFKKLLELLGFKAAPITYTVNMDDIRIPYSYRKSRIRESKWKRKNEYYDLHGTFESPIKIRHDFMLVDGYSSYKIAKKHKLKKVQVQFVD